jgi:hypothetical protein
MEGGMMDTQTLRKYGEKYAEAIRGRLAAEGVAEFTDSELERALAPCVCGHWLVPVAKQLRDDGVSLLCA